MVLHCSIKSMVVIFCQGSMIDGAFSTALPLVIFGVVSTSAGLLVLLVPESQHRKLPESVQDGIKFYE